AAGMMAAISAARYGARVTLFEKNDRLGKKLRITGKGRCNVTNDCDTSEFLQNVPTNPRFLYAALNRFSTADTKQFFEDCGVPLKTERGKRVFPQSDKAQDIVDALVACCREQDVRIVFEKVERICIENGEVTGVKTHSGVTAADAVIVATGGTSYKQTGSDGDGYRFAREAGLEVTRLIPSLVPRTSESRLCARMQGLSLRNVALRICEKASGKTVYEDFGEMMFTHFGLTGPLVLSASAHISDIVPHKYEVIIDLKPALDKKTLDTRLLHDFAKYNNRDFANSLSDLLPQKMIPIIVECSGIPAHKKVNSITKEERAVLCDLLKGFRVSIDGFRPINEAIITKGGVAVNQIRPSTMETKSVKGLYFAGEVLDLDAYTGGFNLQIAFSTAVLAGESAAMGE
ncbi:MAG: NAD(P)/FAD-dependent oxidoreductase, partial [Clostridia bacterium]|nr:NAD(P)/FAD-dependent oxidoreductase [Clostridia bacterium]